MINLFSKKDLQEKEEKKVELNLSEFLGEQDILQQEKIYQQGLVSVLDFISPSALGIYTSYVQIGDVYCRTIFISTYPKVLSVGWLGFFAEIDLPMDMSIFIHPVDTAKIAKNLRKKSAQIQSQIQIEGEKGLVRDPVLEMAYQNVEELRNKIQEGFEKVFQLGVYINIFGKTLDDVEKNELFLESILGTRSIFYKKAIFRMGEGFTSCLPICLDKISSGINLNTSPLSTIFPFISADVTSNKGILYGINKHNNSLILFDRFSMENYNMVIFAKSGAGKSYAVKLEILRSLMVGTEVIVIDPEDEYGRLSESVGGSFIRISLTSKDHINPFDFSNMADLKEEGMREILRSQIASLLGLFRLMLGNLTPEEDSVLEKAIKETYNVRDINENTPTERIKSMPMPMLTDFHSILRNMDGGSDMGMRLEKYTEGIFSGFLNKPTNISMDNRLVVFNIRDLEEELRPVAMYLILSYIWNQIRLETKRRLVVVDEAWIMMKNEDAASFLFGIAKRIRKYYGGLTTITQDVSDFMSSKFGKSIVTNASLQLLLRQSQSSIDILGDIFYLTDREKFILTESKVGEGIFIAGASRAAIQIVASYHEDRIITTDPEQQLQMEDEKSGKIKRSGLEQLGVK